MVVTHAASMPIDVWAASGSAQHFYTPLTNNITINKFQMPGLLASNIPGPLFATYSMYLCSCVRAAQAQEHAEYLTAYAIRTNYTSACNAC